MKRTRRGLKRRYGHTARRGLPRSLKTVGDLVEHAADLRSMAATRLRLAEQSWRSTANKKGLRASASRLLAEAQRADQEVMRLGGEA